MHDHQTLTPTSLPSKIAIFFVTIETSTTQNQSSSSTADSTSASPSLASMLLNQSSGDASESRKANKAAQQQSKEDEDHISKLDIRVGIVRSVTAHPDAESLYIEQGKRQLWLGYLSNVHLSISECFVTFVYNG